MTKKGPLSKAEKFYIESHSDVDIKELCKDLDRAQTIVAKHLKTPTVKKSQQKEKTNSRLYNQFARNDKGSTVMTPNASMLGDDQRKSKAPPTRPSCVTTIRRED